MKKKYLIILFMCFSLYLSSQSIDKNIILEVGKQQFSLINNFTKANVIKSTYEEYFEGTHVYTIINFEQGGYVIVSANYSAPPILAYSHTCSINFNDNSNLGYNYLMKKHATQISYLNNNNIENIEYKKKWNNYITKNTNTTYTIIVDFLIHTNWGQSKPYNILINKNCQDGNHCPTGCVATAMAQIMRYWQHPVEISIGMNYNYCNMPKKISMASSDYKQINEVAGLMIDCGIWSNTSWCYMWSCESFAYPVDAHNAFINTFRYSIDADLDRKIYFTNKKWKKKLKNSLDKQYPILYFAIEGLIGGHAFILDGYDSDDKFHINWGLGGKNNGWFDYNNYVYNVNDSTTWDFDAMERAIFNLHPEKNWLYNCDDTIRVTQSMKDLPYSWKGRDNYYKPKAATIITEDNIFINNYDTVIYQAYKEIIIDELETAKYALFTAEIIDCPNSCPLSGNSKSITQFKKDSIDIIKDKEILFNIYPNPNNGTFTISKLEESDVKTTIKVYNIIGNIILQKQFYNKTIIDITNKPNGIYNIKIIYNNIVINKKIIKN